VSITGVSARYYDGRSSRPLSVTLSVRAGQARLLGDGVELCFDLHQLRVSEPMARAPRLVTLPDGSHCEIDDHAGFAALLDQTGYRDSWVVRLQSSWRHVLAAVSGLAMLCAAGVYWGVPAAASVIARFVPMEYEASLGEQAMAWFDADLMQASKLPQADRDRLAGRFALMAPNADGRRYRIEFRSSRIGPNAFALPGGRIVITDELIAVAGGDEPALAAFAHELGHVHHRHVLRRLVASTLVASSAAVLFGDWSSLLAAAPATLVDLHYSRAMEMEADDYARELLVANGIPVQALVSLLTALEAAQSAERPAPGAGKAPPQRTPDLLRYLSSHPGTEARIARLLRQQP